ncbi:PxKF domain-containing protein [Lysobacter fragariae]
MSIRLGRVLRGCFVACLSWALALPAMAQIRNEGAIPDGRGGVGALAIGMRHTCGIRQDGTAMCWGDNYDGVTKALKGPFIELSAGFDHTCGLRGDGSVACWGAGYTPREGEPEPMPPPPSPIPPGAFTALASGMSTTCGLRARALPWEHPEGNVVCWSAMGWEQLPAPPNGDFVALSLGDGFACGLRANGKPECWGYIDQQQVPVQEAFIAISAGARHACGLHADGSARCWGENWAGQATPPAELFTAISAGAFHTCGLRPDGHAQCWGENGSGQTTPPPDSFVSVTAGVQHTCGVRPDGHVTCWGAVNWNYDYEPPSPSSPMPPIPPQETVFGMGQLAAGDWHDCQLNAEGQLSCWGGFPQDPEPWSRFSAVSSGQDATCARDDSGHLRCYGNNGMVREGLPFEPMRQFDLGYEHACGVAALDGSPKCWGRETNGKTVPPAGLLFRNTSAGLMHSCGVGVDGNGQCWGFNGDGETNIPPLPPEWGFLDVQAGERHSCGLDSALHIRCWGMSPPPYDPSDYNPAHNPDFATFRALSVGAYHSCAIRTDGSLLCWGENWSGQLQAPEGTFVAVSAGHSHTCAIRTDGTRACWGDPWLSPRLVLDPDRVPEVRPGQWLDVSFQLRSESAYQLRDPRYAIVAGTLPMGFWFDPYGMLRGSSNEAGRYPITIEGRDRNGFAARRDFVLSIDGTPPVIEPQVSGTQGENGWYIGPVSLAWSITDPESDILGHYGCDPATIDYEAPEAHFLCDAASAGGPAHQEVIVKVDLVAPLKPEVTATISGTQATFAFVGHDAASGIEHYECSVDGAAYGACAAPLQLQVAAGQHKLQVFAVDGAGHHGDVAEYLWMTDTTPPTIADTIDGIRGLGDWYMSDVQVSWTVTDPDSPITETSGCNTVTQATQTPGAGFTCTATSAGGAASKEVVVKVDKEAPETILQSAPDAQTNSLTATFAFTGQDSLSGVGSFVCILDGGAPTICSSPFTRGVGDGNHTFVVRAYDQAGLRDLTPVTYSWVVDTSPPQVTPTVTGVQGSNGWYTGNVQVSWSVADDSPITTNTGCNTVTVTTDTSGASFTCTATSAGGTTTRTVTIKRDATAPVVTAAATAAPNAAGWYRGDVTVGFTCGDAASGVVSCPAAQVLGGEGNAIASSARTVMDDAGNSATSNVVTVNIDRTAPTLAPTVTPGTLLLNAVTTANPNASDALSGIALKQCGALATGTVGNKSVTCTVTDEAGNSASGSGNYSVVYGFNGFSSPVQNPSVLNVFKAGRSIPLRWRVIDAQGAPVTSLGSASVAALAITCPSATENRISIYGGSNGQLQNLGNGYYGLDWAAAASLRNACRRLELNLGDGVARPAQFKFN